MFTYIKTHFPLIVGIALVVVNALVDQGYITLSGHVAALINAILAALGFGVLHYRSVSK